MADEKDSPRNCQSCDRKDSAESRMVQCDRCKLWEHYGCAGVDERIQQPGVKYECMGCSKKGKSTDEHLKVRVGEARPSKGSKASSKAVSKRGKKPPNPSQSVTSSVQAALLAEQLKLVEEERKMEEQALLEEEQLKKQLLEEEERQLEEKRKLADEAKKIRERKLQDELESKRKQQQIRRESFEKRQVILQQLAETSSRGGSVVNSNQNVKDWLLGQGAGRSTGNQSGESNTPNDNQVPGDPADVPSASSHIAKTPSMPVSSRG